MSVCCMYIYDRILFHYDNFCFISGILFKFCMCIDIGNISYEIVNGQILVIIYRIMAPDKY